MNSNRIIDIVKRYRTVRILGKFVDLVPFTLADSHNVIEIRNREKNLYYLNQAYLITSESQAKWYETYLNRFNDIYWCIYNKENKFIGTVRIYDIDDKNDICDQGSLMIDDDVASSGPFAIEVEILTLDFIFEVLKIGNVVNEDRADNKVMNNLTKRFGFKHIKNTNINGVDYKYYILSKDDYKEKRETFASIIEYWEQR